MVVVLTDKNKKRIASFQSREEGVEAMKDIALQKRMETRLYGIGNNATTLLHTTKRHFINWYLNTIYGNVSTMKRIRR